MKVDRALAAGREATFQRREYCGPPRLGVKQNHERKKAGTLHAPHGSARAMDFLVPSRRPDAEKTSRAFLREGPACA